MPQILQNNRKKRRLRVLVLAVVVAVLALAVALAVYMHVSAVNADNEEFTNLQTIANLDSSSEHYDQGATLWLNYAAKTSNHSHRASAYASAAAMYLSAKQYDKALAECRQSERVEGVTYEEAEAAAYAAGQLGDKTTAIHYYQEAIKLMPSSISDPATQKDLFNQAIQDLQAGS